LKLCQAGKHNYKTVYKIIPSIIYRKESQSQWKAISVNYGRVEGYIFELGYAQPILPNYYKGNMKLVFWVMFLGRNSKPP